MNNYIYLNVIIGQCPHNGHQCRHQGWSTGLLQLSSGSSTGLHQSSQKLSLGLGHKRSSDEKKYPKRFHLLSLVFSVSHRKLPCGKVACLAVEVQPQQKLHVSCPIFWTFPVEPLCDYVNGVEGSMSSGTIYGQTSLIAGALIIGNFQDSELGIEMKIKSLF